MSSSTRALPADSPLFTVIIPVYNRRGLLPHTIETVLQQRFTDFEVIVLDDGSTDGSADVARSFGERIRVFQEPNAGIGAARNRAARAAKGRYLAFLDSDDLWFPWTLETYAAIIESSRQPAFIAGKPLPFEGEPPALQGDGAPVAVEEFSDYLASSDEWRLFGGSSLLIRRDAFRAVGGFTSIRVTCEDADMAMRLGVAPGFVQVKAPDTFAYRTHAASVTGGRDLDGMARAAAFLLEAERADRYPGGASRAVERRRILGRHIRPVITACFRQGLHRHAWKLYGDTLKWHVQSGRWKFIVGAPFQSAVHRASSL